MSFRCSVWALLNGAFMYLASEQIYQLFNYLQDASNFQASELIKANEKINELKHQLKWMGLREELLVQRVEELEDEYIHLSTNNEDDSPSESK